MAEALGTVESFAAALYRLAKRYPSADHFRWQA